MESHQLRRDGPGNSANCGGRVSQSQCNSPECERRFYHAIGHAKQLPDRTVAEIVILLAVRKRRSQHAALRGAQAAMVEESFLSEIASLPALHASCRHGNPVDASRLVGNVASDFLEATAAKHLTAASHMILALETVAGRIVAAFFAERRAGDAELVNVAK